MINPSFNLKFLNSFHDVFVKYSSEMVKFLNNTEANEQTDLVSVIWEKTLDSALGKKRWRICYQCDYNYFNSKFNKRETTCHQEKIRCH